VITFPADLELPDEWKRDEFGVTVTIILSNGTCSGELEWALWEWDSEMQYCKAGQTRFTSVKGKCLGTTLRLPL
jgi:hypothetical protein